MLTYGDAVGNIDLKSLQEFHVAHGRIGTICLYNFGQNKGVVELGKDGLIDTFREKSDLDGDLINIGFMMFEPRVFDYIDDDNTFFEKDTLTRLAQDKELSGYLHDGYWQCMDTIREKQLLEEQWESGKAPWKIWS